MHYIQSLVHTYRPSIIPLSLSHTSNLNLSALQILSQTLHTGIKNKLSKTWEHVWMSVQKAVHEFQGKSNDSQTPFWKRKGSGYFSKTSFCPQKSVCNNKTNMHYTELLVVTIFLLQHLSKAHGLINPGNRAGELGEQGVHPLSATHVLMLNSRIHLLQ